MDVFLINHLDGFLSQYRKGVRWDEKTPPNTLARSGYLNRVSRHAMCKLALHIPSAQLHVVECRSDDRGEYTYEWYVHLADTPFSILGKTTLDAIRDALLARARCRFPHASTFNLNDTIKQPQGLLPLLLQGGGIAPEGDIIFDQLWGPMMAQVAAESLIETTLPTCQNRPKNRI